jgi:hypothetical protein
MNVKSASILIAVAAGLFLAMSTACGSSALEAKRMADQCNATYGFNTSKSVSCMNTGYEEIAVAAAASVPISKGL